MDIPVARRDTLIEDYHGTPVADPYRWLEDADSEETQKWSEAQDAAARAYLAALPAQKHLKARITELWNYPKYTVPSKAGGYYYYTLNSGLQNQAVLYRSQGLGGEPFLVLDPNTLSEDGTTALMDKFVSKDGTLMAYSIASHGSDQQDIRIRDLASGTDYDEVIRWGRFTEVTWRHDNRGFYYSRFPEPGTVPDEDLNNYRKVYWHEVGTPQSMDELIYERPDAKELGFSPHITNDGQYLTLTVWQGTSHKNRFYYREVESTGDFVRLLDEADASYIFLGNHGPVFYFQTTFDAPHGRIVAIDMRQPERTHWQEVLPEQEDVIDFAFMVNQQFVVVYMHNAHHRIKLYQADGAFEREVALPTLGSIVAVSGKQADSEFFISFTSYLRPPSIYRYDFTEHTLTPLHEGQSNFDESQYETYQVFYPSKGGTQVSMFLTHKKGLVRDGTNPTFLYGYGGFNISLAPTFAIDPLVWVEQGGVYAVANLRGGGEYGEVWHEAGMLEKKQNVFDDFIAAAEWLIANAYTSTPRLAIHGRSNGGLLVGACLVQRPDLYGAVVCGVPVLDMLRYHRFTVGRFWIPEYGDAESNPEHFKFMYAYSPLHNVKEGTVYPPTLVMTADSDDRVVPAHAKKFTATLQRAQGGTAPIFLRLDMKAGHGMGKPTDMVIEEKSDMLAFLFDALKIG